MAEDRVDAFEQTIRKLQKRATVTLAVAVLALAAAAGAGVYAHQQRAATPPPAEPPTKIVLKNGGRELTLDPMGIELTGPDGLSSRLRAGDLNIANPTGRLAFDIGLDITMTERASPLRGLTVQSPVGRLAASFFKGKPQWKVETADAKQYAILRPEHLAVSSSVTGYSKLAMVGVAEGPFLGLTDIGLDYVAAERFFRIEKKAGTP
jgi:hypothetical protein